MAKPPYRVRAISVYVDSDKVATAESGSFDEDGNDEEVITESGWSMSDGTITSKLKVDVIIAVTGETRALKQAFRKKKYLRVEFTPDDGDITTVIMRITKFGRNWNWKTGVSKGGFEFSGGEPSDT